MVYRAEAPAPFWMLALPEAAAADLSGGGGTVTTLAGDTVGLAAGLGGEGAAGRLAAPRPGAQSTRQSMAKQTDIPSSGSR